MNLQQNSIVLQSLRTILLLAKAILASSMCQQTRYLAETKRTGRTHQYLSVVDELKTR